MKNATLWVRDFRILTLASILGAAGAVAGNYALSFLVYEHTHSTLAAGLLLSLQVIPQFILPILIAPVMDCFPRKPFLVYGDLISGLLYTAAGAYLRVFSFSYTGYLLFSLILACIGALDSLAYHSIFPSVIPEGFEEKGYTVAGMLYPLMNVMVMPLAAVLLRSIGVSNILLIQGGCSIMASWLENTIKIEENRCSNAEKSGFFRWLSDFTDGFRFLKGERGLRQIFLYMAFTNGIALGYSPILVAFFSITPGFTATMYSFFAAAEFIGRSLGGLVHYQIAIPKKNKFRFICFVYGIYEFMDMILLWLPYPFMLVNRGICGFLGVNSATERTAAVQRYIPEEYRARVNAFENALVSAAGGILSLAVGSMGEWFTCGHTMAICAATCLVACFFTIGRHHKLVRKIYES